MWSRVLDWLTEKHWLVGASLLRISLGAWGVFFYLLHWRVRHAIWGPDGLYSHSLFLTTNPSLTVFQFSPSPLLLESVYLTTILVSILLMLGVWPRLMVLLFWIATWSFQERNFLITDGGDNIMRIILFFLVLVDCGAYFSVDAWRGRAGQRARLFVDGAKAIAHNVGVLVILAQLALLYISTGMYKVMGELWQNGTALYYILRVDEFTWPGVAEYFYRNPYLVVGGTYGTVLFELLFAPSLFTRWTRYLMILAGLTFHLGIVFMMGLVTFGWSMLSLYPLLLTDQEYDRAVAWFKQRLTLTVFYDGWCPLCTRSIRWLSQMDLFSLVRYVSFREPGVIEQHHLSATELEQRIQSVDHRGRIAAGINTMTQIATRSLLLWPIVPVLIACRLATGQRGYDAVASRRIALVPGRCAGHCTLDERMAVSK